jgi:hypothetical protein
MGEIPPFVQYTSPATIHEHGSQLPLNLIARIVSYLDDPGDIARVTRTSRLLYYMTLPQLYQHVALHSYSDIKYVNGRPEGYGSGSPFMMALNGLVTKSYAGVVQHFRVWGEWKDVGADDFAKGRVPDNSMMLNMMLRVCVDKMVKLRAAQNPLPGTGSEGHSYKPHHQVPFQPPAQALRVYTCHAGAESPQGDRYRPALLSRRHLRPHPLLQETG